MSSTIDNTKIFKLHSVQEPEQAGLLLVNSPHSGRDYSILENTGIACPIQELRDYEEDTFMDDIASLSSLGQYGITALEALFPRSYIDANRSNTSLDKSQIRGWTGQYIDFFMPDSFSARGGGLVPVRIVSQNKVIYEPENYPTEEEIAKRLKVYKAYHQQLQKSLHDIFNRYGGYALLDMHSCYPWGIVETGAGENRADIILSNCHGQSCSEEFLQVVKTAYMEQGFRDFAINHPFKGGYIASNYGRGGVGIFAAGQVSPSRSSQNINALQIEINKRLYWDFDKDQQKPEAQAIKQANIAVFKRVHDYTLSLA